MFAFNALTHSATRLFLEHIKGNARCLTVEVQRYRPLQAIPLLEELVRSLTLCNSILDLLVAVDHLAKLHGQIIFIFHVSAHGN